jgi:catechol 2,3-dioxygenase-like lactoylglutathione lyase family enzyme
MKVKELDHLVLTANDIDKTINFYTTVFGMELVSFEDGRKSLRFSSRKSTCTRQDKRYLLMPNIPCPVQLISAL